MHTTDNTMQPDPSLSGEDLEELEIFLMSEDMPENGMDISTLDGFLELNVKQLEVLPSHQKLTLSRTLLLSVAPDAIVQLPQELPGVGLTMPLSDLKSGWAATVYTQQASATLAALRGDDAALTAAKISL